MAKVKHKIMVMSGKGCMGKTTVAALAFAPGMSGLDVGLMDADIRGPDVPVILGIDKKVLVIVLLYFWYNHEKRRARIAEGK